MKIRRRNVTSERGEMRENALHPAHAAQDGHIHTRTYANFGW